MNTESKARAQLGLERKDRPLRRDGQRLCAPAVLGLLHPIRRRRSDGHLRPGQERSAPVQVRLGHGLELQPHPRQTGEIVGRRYLQRLDELLGSARSRGGRDKRRHHPARREDGLPGHGSPEIESFITWKVREEKKAKALIAAGYESDFNGEAYHTVSGQNSNNSVRVSDDFMKPRSPAANGRRARGPLAR